MSTSTFLYRHVTYQTRQPSSIFWCALLIGVIALLGLCIGFRT